MKIGVNEIRFFMKDICHALDLSKEYKNHSVHATAITILGESFQDTDVAAVSGHKSLTNLIIYKRTSNEMKSKMSAELQKAFVGHSSNSAKAPPSPPIQFLSPAPVVDNCPSTSHNGCCFSYGVHQLSTPREEPDVIDVDAIEDSIPYTETSPAFSERAVRIKLWKWTV